MVGYRGKILQVNLDDGATTVKSLDEILLKQFIGGAGLGTRLLYDMINSNTDPLGPENPLIFMTGPCTGTAVPTSGKSTFCARSPKTGLLGYSTVGGHFGADLKFAGYDGIIITGVSEEPCYLLVEDSDIEIRNARHLWGKDTEQVWDILKKETNHKTAGIARIGIAGENLVKYASIIVDHHRAAGRTGLGAVMGAKKLKAIVVHGSDRKVPVAHEEELQRYTKELNEDSKEDPTFRMYSDLGTAGYIDMASLMYGSFPAGYYTVGDFDTYNLSGTTVKETILVGKTACFRCPIGCGRVVEVPSGKYKMNKFAGPELEVTGTMGSLLLNNNVESVAYANMMFDLFGIDTISGGNTIAFAYYLFKEGRITAKDLDGISPEWGEIDSALAFIEKIAKREGIGDLMAEGSFQFGSKFGVQELAAQVNGLELPQHDPRGFSGLAAGYATSPRGACHMAADMYNVQMGQPNEAFGIDSMDRFANEADLVARHQDFRCVTNSAVICNFYPVDGDKMTRLLRLVTGWDISVADVVMSGERIFTLMRLLNLKLGYDTKNEILPELISRPLEGATEEHVPDINEHLNKWYETRGWRRDSGRPPNDRLKILGLENLV
ncbi:MAG: aldehyde ferredoxin oxidoreductase family protein [Candidatus Thorarchaeota archaeon]|nr:aldehyde ferredoxin oxidoreductase family protein [Candidatus Thorarchaeota archaeon]